MEPGRDTLSKVKSQPVENNSSCWEWELLKCSFLYLALPMFRRNLIVYYHQRDYWCELSFWRSGYLLPIWIVSRHNVCISYGWWWLLCVDCLRCIVLVPWQPLGLLQSLVSCQLHLIVCNVWANATIVSIWKHILGNVILKFVAPEAGSEGI